MSATRTLIEAIPGAPSEMPRWLQLGSGIAFVCLLFTGTAAVGAVALLTVFLGPTPPARRRTHADERRLRHGLRLRRARGRHVHHRHHHLLRTRGLLPRWLAVLSYLAAAFLLVSTTYHPAVLLVLPGWVTAVSVALTAHSFRKGSPLSTSVQQAPHATTPSGAGRRSRRHASPTSPALSPQETSHEHDHRT